MLTEEDCLYSCMWGYMRNIWCWQHMKYFLFYSLKRVYYTQRLLWKLFGVKEAADCIMFAGLNLCMEKCFAPIVLANLLFNSSTIWIRKIVFRKKKWKNKFLFINWMFFLGIVYALWTEYFQSLKTWLKTFTHEQISKSPLGW